MVHLFVGGGAEGKIPELDKKFALELSKQREKKLLYLPIAHPEITYKGIKYTYAGMFEGIKWHYAKFGVTQIDMWTDLSNKTSNDLNGYGAIYIGGGNTFSLMDQFRKNGFDKLLNEYMDKNGIVYGSSAGAAILGKDICIVSKFGEDPDINHINLTDLSSFDKLDGKIVFPHYREVDDNNLQNYIKKTKSMVIAIPSLSGLHISGNEAEVLGVSDAYFFKNTLKLKLYVGKRFAFPDLLR